MDSPGLSPGRHRKALRALARINLVSRTAHRFWSAIRDLTGHGTSEPLRVLDIACGGGDVAIYLQRLGRAHGLAIEVDGCDVNPAAVRYAREQAASAAARVRFFELDVINAALPEGYDIICSSLFLHHLSEPQAVDLLHRMASSTRRTVLLQDLVRSRLGYAMVYVGVRLLTRSQVVYTDSSLSVQAAFSIDEVRALTATAGLEGATISRCWPQRFLLSWQAG
ncbi:MAG: methyltransferase domain-containing protein [Acidobacteriota bacterium]